MGRLTLGSSKNDFHAFGAQSFTKSSRRFPYVATAQFNGGFVVEGSEAGIIEQSIKEYEKKKK